MVSEVFRQLAEAYLSTRLSKSVIGTDKVKLFWQEMCHRNTPLLSGVETILRHTTKKECAFAFWVDSVLSCPQSSLRPFAASFTDLLKKRNTKSKWGDEQERAYSTVKNLLNDRRIIQLPDHDKPFILKNYHRNK